MTKINYIKTNMADSYRFLALSKFREFKFYYNGVFICSNETIGKCVYYKIFDFEHYNVLEQEFIILASKNNIKKFKYMECK